MMKRSALACLLAISTSAALASTAVTPVSAAPTAAHAAAASAVVAAAKQAQTTSSSNATPVVADTVDANGAPINQYGAIDANATIPMSAQVPPAPASFQEPVISPLAATWSNTVPTQPTLKVASYILVNASNGQVLAAYNANNRIAPASITKLMLVYITEQQLAAGAIHLTDTVTVPTVAWATGGSRMFLKPGDSVTVQQLIDGVLVDSGNDAATALAIYVAGSQTGMVSLMNAEAQKLGMTNTHFSDVMGLPAPNHYSSAHDLALLAQAVTNNYPQYFSWFGTKSFTYDNIKQYNFNKLLFMYQYADGLKTGSTQEGGYSLTATAKLPNNPMRLISVVIGAPSNNQVAMDSKALLMYGFRFFQSNQVYAANQTLKDVAVQQGAQKTVPVGVQQAVYATYPRSITAPLSVQLEVDKTLTAPIAQGQVVGQVVVSANGTTVATVPAVAMAPVARGSWWQRMMEKA